MKESTIEFRGTINGVEYNDIKEYNKRITELINNNQPIEASTSTRRIVSDEIEEDGPDLTPLMDDVDYYIDLSYDEIYKYLTKQVVKIKEYIDTHRDKSLESLKENYKTICNILNEDQKSLQEEVDGLEKELNELEEQQCSCDLMTDVYKDLISYIDRDKSEVTNNKEEQQIVCSDCGKKIDDCKYKEGDCRCDKDDCKCKEGDCGCRKGGDCKCKKKEDRDFNKEILEFFAKTCKELGLDREFKAEDIEAVKKLF